MIGNVFVGGSAPTNLAKLENTKCGYLLKILQEDGFTLSHNPRSEIFICLDFNKKQYSDFISSGGSPDRAFLIRIEPKAIFPAQYTKMIEEMFNQVFSPGLLKNDSQSILGWPHALEADPTKPGTEIVSFEDFKKKSSESEFASWTSRSIKLSMIAANKVSPISDGNYGIRRDLAHKLPMEILHVYGSLWNSSFWEKAVHRLKVLKFNVSYSTPVNLFSIYGNFFRKYSTARGFVSNKFRILNDSKFALVIENSNTYVSEKIFDAIYAGTVPLYLGPPLQKFGLPSNIAIPIRGEREEILTILQTITNEDVIRILKAGKSFLNGKVYQNEWTENMVYRRIAERIEQSFTSL